jgi:hypothetical protein
MQLLQALWAPWLGVAIAACQCMLVACLETADMLCSDGDQELGTISLCRLHSVHF